MKLYELTTNYQQVQGMIDNPDIDPQTILDTLEAIQGEIEVKAVNLARIMQQMQADEDICKTEERRLAERRRAIENRREGIKRYLQEQMELAGLDKIKTATVTVAIAKNPPSVKVITPEAIPQKYLIPQEPAIDRKGILAALKAGEEVIGCELQQGRSLRIR